MTIDLDALKSTSAAGGPPPDGVRTARLDRAQILDTRNGRRLKTNWTGSDRTAWESWDSLARGDRFFDRAKGLVQGILGAKLDRIETEDELEFELAAAEGQTFEVRAESNGTFVNTHFEGAAQQQLMSDVPVTDADYQPPPLAPGEDDIPF